MPIDDRDDRRTPSNAPEELVMDLLAALQAADYTKAQPLIEKVLKYEPANELMLEYRVVVQRALKRADDHAEDAPTTNRWRLTPSASSASSTHHQRRRATPRTKPKPTTIINGGAARGPGRGRVAGHGRRAARERGLHPARRGEEATTESQGRRASLRERGTVRGGFRATSFCGVA